MLGLKSHTLVMLALLPVFKLNNKVDFFRVLDCAHAEYAPHVYYSDAAQLYIMLNKPVGYVSTAKDQFDRPTVVDLIKEDLGDVRIFPVGRLDYETEGLLLLTNDGDFTYKVTHPKFHTDKTYIATIKGGITISGINKLRNGVYIDDFKTSPAEAEILDAVDGHTYIKITIHEGKNRQVRKMFAAIGCTVVGLQRIKIGNVELGNLPLGRWRHLTSHEVNYLMNS